MDDIIIEWEKVIKVIIKTSVKDVTKMQANSSWTVIVFYVNTALAKEIIPLKDVDCVKMQQIIKKLMLITQILCKLSNTCLLMSKSK